jgi:glycine/D-amino acid oxidase-like deaminating enzyme
MKENHQRQVIVLEARNQCFQGASGYNSGLLSWHWFSDELRQLAHHSFRIYQNLAREAVDFKEICDYHEDSLNAARKDRNARFWVIGCMIIMYDEPIGVVVGQI